MSNSQLTDDGAVIGYQPNLFYDKSINQNKNTNNQEETKEEKIDSSKELHTRSLIYLLNNLPFKALANISTSKTKLNNLINELSEHFKTSNYDKFDDINALLTAMQSNNQDYIDSFVEYHSHNIKGSIIPELINNIYESIKRLDVLDDTLKTLYYNNPNITKEEAKEKDREIINNISHNENDNLYHKINYISMSYDSSLNRLVSLYTYGIVENCSALSNIINTEETLNVNKNTSVIFIESIYNQINKDIDSRVSNYNSYQNIEILPKTLYNYYYTRQNLLNFYNLTGETNSVFLVKQITDCQDKLDEAVEQVAKIMLGNRKHIELITEKEEEKYIIQNAYNDAIANLNE